MVHQEKNENIKFSETKDQGYNLFFQRLWKVVGCVCVCGKVKGMEVGVRKEKGVSWGILSVAVVDFGTHTRRVAGVKLLKRD